MPSSSSRSCGRSDARSCVTRGRPNDRGERAGEAEKVEALDRGANEYATKPSGIAALLARAALRTPKCQVGEQPSELVAGDLSVDLACRRSRAAGPDVKLSRKEFDILRLLAQHAGRIG